VTNIVNIAKDLFALVFGDCKRLCQFEYTKSFVSYIWTFVLRKKMSEIYTLSYDQKLLVYDFEHDVSLLYNKLIRILLNKIF